MEQRRMGSGDKPKKNSEKGNPFLQEPVDSANGLLSFFVGFHVQQL